MTFRATILTLYPEMFPGPLGAVALPAMRWRAEIWSLEAKNIRDHGIGRHRNVDDTPAGGGPGMVLRCDVLAAAIDAAAPRRRSAPAASDEPARQAADARPRARARGRPRRDHRLRPLRGRRRAGDRGAAALEEVSIGDYVLSGGEMAAMVLLDACVRLLPGVMGKEASGTEESFEAQPPRISPLHAPARMGGPRDSRRAAQRQPCRHRTLAARGSGEDHARAAAGSAGEGVAVKR